MVFWNTLRKIRAMKRRTSLSLPQSLLRELDREAIALGLSRSAYVTALLESRGSACLSAGQKGREEGPKMCSNPGSVTVAIPDTD